MTPESTYCAEPRLVVYYHIAASGWIITGNTVIQLYTINETRNAEKICPGTHARLIKI